MLTTILSRTLKLSALAAALFAAFPASAQNFPDKPVRLLLPFPAGGGVDANGRLIAKALSEMWKVPVVVENMAGAATSIMTKAVIGAKPDGYTLGMVTSRVAINPAMYASMPYTNDDFLPITQVLTSPLYIIANPKTPGANLAELVKYAKEHPNQITTGTAGVGDITSLPIEILNRAGVQIKQIPYIGGAAALTAVLSGEVNLTLSVYPVWKSMLQENRLKVVAVTGDSRSPNLPNVPAVKEAVPAYSGVDEWYGVIGPKGIPAPIVDKIQKDIAKAMETKELKDRFASDGNVVVGSTPDQFAAFLKKETDTWKKRITEIGLPPMELK